MTRWVLFLDVNDVPRVEKVNEGIWVFTRYLPFRPAKRRWWGLGKEVMPARQSERQLHIQFDDRFYDRERYCESAFRDPPPGYERDHNIVYCQENYWGPVNAIAFYEDDVGSVLHEVLSHTPGVKAWAARREATLAMLRAA